jgi:3-oxoacyl-[acyl-carrier protein] reductase
MEQAVILITGTRKGIGRFLAEYYASRDYRVVGCSRGPMDVDIPKYRHYCLDITNETDVKAMFNDVNTRYKRLDILINNAGIAMMNHTLLTPMAAVDNVLKTNVAGTYLFCRESAKIMKKNNMGRIINFSTVAVPLKLEGEAIYAASKAAVVSLTQIMAREFADFGITVNTIGPTPIQTDLIRSIPKEKIESLIQRQAIKRFGTFDDVVNTINFFISPQSGFITGQTLYLGGV